MKTVLKTLCETHGVAGHSAIADVITAMVRPLCDEVKTDALGDVIAVRRCGKANAPMLLLEAHMDEIGFVVTHIDDNGFLYVSNSGGIDRRVLAAAEVVVLADKPLNGVFCSTPPHLSDGDEKIASVEERGIDVGLPAQDVKTLVPVGTRVAFRPAFCKLGETLVSCKALDDRAGCAAVIKTLELLKDEALSCDITALFSVQEEVGGAGAVVSAFNVMPQAAIAVDVSFAATPDAPAHQCGSLGKGVMLGMAPGLDRAMTKRLSDLADADEIPLQIEVMGGSTGTDADHIYCTKTGIPTALLSIPQRYMHTPIEAVDVRDVESVARLMTRFAKEGLGE